MGPRRLQWHAVGHSVLASFYSFDRKIDTSLRDKKTSKQALSKQAGRHAVTQANSQGPKPALGHADLTGKQTLGHADTQARRQACERASK